MERVTRAFEIFSTDKFLEEQIELMRAVFSSKQLSSLGNYKVINKVKEKPKVTKADND